MWYGTFIALEHTPPHTQHKNPRAYYTCTNAQEAHTHIHTQYLQVLNAEVPNKLAFFVHNSNTMNVVFGCTKTGKLKRYNDKNNQMQQLTTATIATTTTANNNISSDNSNNSNSDNSSN